MIVEGEMGIGKSSILKELARKLPEHIPIYFDCTTKADAGDVMMPKFKDLDGQDYVSFATNEELGMHLKDQKLIIMIDEVGKNKSIQNPMNRLFQERMVGMNTLHPESIVFGTTNLGFEGVGDSFLAHSCNRVTFVRMRKPTAMEWIEWGIGDGDIDHTMPQKGLKTIRRSWRRVIASRTQMITSISIIREPQVVGRSSHRVRVTRLRTG